MAERLSRLVLYVYGIADLFFALMVNMEAYFFTAFLIDYAQFSLAGAGQILGFTSLIDNDSDVLKMQEEIAARKTGIRAEA